MPYTMSGSVVGECEVVIGVKKMDDMKQFYLGTALSKHGEMEGEIKESIVRGRCNRSTCKL